MRPAVGVSLGLCALAGCFFDTTPQLTGPVDPSTGSDGSTASTSTSTSTSATSDAPTVDPTEVTTAGTTGTCPMGQPEKAWYPDLDGDGFGADDGMILACDAPPGAVDVPGDCDDAVFEINPDAVELCNDVDDDCDGLRDEYSPDNTACGDCSLSEFGGQTFWICGDALPFLAAEARCQEFGAAVHLVHPLNNAELGFVRDRIFDHLGAMPAELHFWTAIHRIESLWDECTQNPGAESWVALDGAPVTYLPWLDLQPDNADCPLDCTAVDLDDPACLRSNCVELFDGPTAAYNDIACSSTAAGLACEAPL